MQEWNQSCSHTARHFPFWCKYSMTGSAFLKRDWVTDKKGEIQAKIKDEAGLYFNIEINVCTPVNEHTFGFITFEAYFSQSLLNTPESCKSSFPVPTSCMSGFPGLTSRMSGFPGLTSCMSGFPDLTSCMSGFPGLTSRMSGFPNFTSCMSAFPGLNSCMRGFQGSTPV
jgi:hypothetical protein